MNRYDHGVLAPGTRVADYAIVDVIGRGGFGITYHVREEASGSEFALKEFFPEDLVLRDGTEVRFNGRRNSESDYQWSLRKFHDEAKLLAQFKHPNIVRLLRVFEANNSAYMVLDFIRGRTFEGWLQTIEGPPTQEELDIVATALLDALELVHDNRANHLDISPDNIMIRSADGMPILLDFGASRVEIKRHSHLVSALVVKRGYSAPEQYSAGASQYGAWTDIFAFAATLYRAIAGEPPLESTQRVSKDAQITALQIGHGRYRNDFLEAIDWALTLAAEDRPQSIREWRVPLLGEKAARQKARAIIPHTPTVRLKVYTRPDVQPLADVTASSDSVVRDRIDIIASPQKSRSRALMVACAAAVFVICGALFWSDGLWNRPSELGRPQNATKPALGIGTAPAVRNDADDSAFAKAEHENVLGGWQSYLSAYPNGQHAAKAQARIQARIGGNRLVQTFATQTGNVDLMIEPTGNSGNIIAVGRSGRIEEYEFSTSALLRSSKAVGQYPQAMSPDGRQVVTNEGHGVLKQWIIPEALSFESPREVRPLRGHAADIYSACFLQDSRTLVTGAADNTLKLWDVSTGRQVRTMRGASRTQVAVYIACAPDSQSIVSGSIDRVFKVWNSDTGAEVRNFAGHTEPIEAVAISAGGTLVASASRDALHRVWDVASGRIIQSFPGAKGSFQGVVYPKIAFSHDGQFFAASGGIVNGDLQLWEISSGRAVLTLAAGRVSSLQFTRDGRFLLAGTESGEVRLWDVTAL